MSKNSSLRVLTRLVAFVAIIFSLSACLFSEEPVLDESNSESGEESQVLRDFLEAWRIAYGFDVRADYEIQPPPAFFANTFLKDKAGIVDLASIRIAPLDGDKFLVQQTLDECPKSHCFVYYRIRFIEPWWPENCLADTVENGSHLRDFARQHAVRLIDIADSRDETYFFFGMNGTRIAKLELLRGQFTDGWMICSSDGNTTPLHWAVSGHVSSDHSLTDLIKSGVSVQARDVNGSTPLHIAAANAWLSDPLSVLIQAGAEVNASDKMGSTPLHYAATFASADSVEVLISAGAEIDARDRNGSTPLHDAAASLWGGYIEGAERVRLLVDAGADVNARGINGSTPLHQAAASGSPDVIQLLLDAGAEGGLVDEDGKMPFQRLAENEFFQFEGTDVYWRLKEAALD